MKEKKKKKKKRELSKMTSGRSEVADTINHHVVMAMSLSFFDIYPARN